MLSLETVQLNNNRFIGTLPDELSNTFSITSLALHSNRLTGDLPIFPSTVVSVCGREDYVYMYI
jgi:hypothetical protein